MVCLQPVGGRHLRIEPRSVQVWALLQVDVNVNEHVKVEVMWWLGAAELLAAVLWPSSIGP